MAEPCCLEWRRVDKGKPYSCEKQYAYSGCALPFSTDATLADDEMGATDDASCALDSFNAAVACRVLTREDVGVPEGPINFDNPVARPRQAVREAGYDLKAIVKRGKNQPAFDVILGQRVGVFLVEFYWRKAGARDWHVVAINCDQRRVFCNTIGVVPFHKLEVVNESATTHAWVRRQFFVRSVQCAARTRSRCALRHGTADREWPLLPAVAAALQPVLLLASPCVCVGGPLQQQSLGWER